MVLLFSLDVPEIWGALNTACMNMPIVYGVLKVIRNLLKANCVTIDMTTLLC